MIDDDVAGIDSPNTTQLVHHGARHLSCATEWGAIFDRAAEAMLVTREDGLIQAVNRAACELVGRPKREILGHSLWDLADARPTSESEPGSRAERSGAHRRELVVERAGRSPRVLEVRGGPLPGERSSLIVLREVTDDRWAQETLQAVLEAAPVMLLSVDASGRITRVMGRLPGSLECSTDHLPDTSLASVVPTITLPKDGETPTESVLSKVLAGETLQGRITNVEASFEAHLMPQRLTAQSASGALAVIRDVTDLRSAERERTELGETLKAVIDAAPVAIIQLDAEGKVLLWNGAAETIFGWTHDEMIGRALPFADPKLLDLVIRRGESLTNQQVMRPHKDGRLLDLSLSLAPVRNAAGHPVGAVGTFVDISERLELEHQFWQAQKMESIGRLAGGIAHDFNNVLAAILIIGQDLMGNFEESHPARDEMREILEAAQRAASLTRQLLAFGRNQVLSPTTVDLNEQLSTTSRMLRRMVPESISFVHRPHPRPLPVLVDPTQLEQVLLNLAVNAQDAMPHGGELTLSTEARTITDEDAKRWPEASPGRYAVIVVRDTGMGMDPETLSRAFDPFFTTKPEGRGTGLGLATVHGIIRQSGGHVRARSEVGRGTEFAVYLPLLNDGAQVPPKPLSTYPTGEHGKGSILVVEDEDKLRQALVRVLSREGYLVLEAANAGEALLMLERHPGQVDVLLSDVVMPRVSGSELARRIAASHPDLRVLLMTGHARDELDAELTYEVIPKPFSRRSLLEAIRRALAGVP